ncbi:ferredoxin reductase [Pseudofrankia asymbiotica]|uniref:Ferredoxin reductase n=1 Tax=Pseudofrankia asymbiotica TaxID=1834516 RepID=A0A1V2I8Q5_9ACTN|nr:ferredoxin reductase [Pseudofrankia asymbiotica]
MAVVGAGIGGLRAAEALRDAGHDGPITVFGAEGHAPYSRPPLSKDLLAGQHGSDKIVLRATRDLGDVRWRLGEPVVACDLAARHLTTGDGAEVEFEGLVVATGVRSRRLSLAGPKIGRYALRGLDDALTLRPLLREGARLVVIGAGFIGCEVAATARRLGCEVTIVAPEQVPMERPLGFELGAMLMRRHLAHDVRFRLGRGVRALLGEDRVTGVVLTSGEVLGCDLVVEAVGSVPNVEWLTGNGLDLANGVNCDEFMRAEGRADVVAVGDVARFPNRMFEGVATRVEHWNIPLETARQAAPALLAGLADREPVGPAFAPLPVFWTHQFDIRLQSFGAPGLGLDDVRVLDGDLDEGPVVMGYHRAGRLVGIVGTGGPRQLLPHRARLLAEAAPTPREPIAG